MNTTKFRTLIALIAAFTLMSCSDDARVASHNISKASDNFEVNRRVVFYNGITGEYMLTIEGSLSINHSGRQLEVTIKTGPKSYKKHFLGLSDNVTYFCEQISSEKVSPHYYRVTFKPSTIIPDVDVR